MFSNPLEECLGEHLKPEFLSANLCGLVKAHRSAVQACAPLAKPQRKDVFGHVLRGFVEKSLYDTATRFPGVSAENCQNDTRTSNHVRVRSGKLIFTASSVESAEQLPRSADFRNGLAYSSQATLFAEPVEHNPEDFVYAVLTYCTATDGGIYDAALVFPDHTGKNRLWWRPLRSELSEAIEEVRQEAPEEKVPEVQPGLRENVEKTQSAE